MKYENDFKKFFAMILEDMYTGDGKELLSRLYTYRQSEAVEKALILLVQALHVEQGIEELDIEQLFDSQI